MGARKNASDCIKGDAVKDTKRLAVILLLSIAAFAKENPDNRYSLELQIKDSSPGNMTFTDGASDYSVSCHRMPSVGHFLFPGGGFYGLHESKRKDLCLDYPVGTRFRARIVDNKLEGFASASSGSRPFSYKLVSTNKPGAARNTSIDSTKANKELCRSLWNDASGHPICTETAK